MKKLFNIDESEKLRILEMHKKLSIQNILSEEIPYTPIKDTKTYKQPEVITNINPKNLKVGDGGTKNPKLKNDVIALQQKLIEFGCLSTDTGKPTGYFGNKTNSALTKYNQQGPCNQSINKDEDIFSGNSLKPKNKDGVIRPKTSSEKGFVVTFSFPTYKPKIDGNSKFDLMVGAVARLLTTSGYDIIVKGEKPWDVKDKTYGKLGHGGVATITSDGNVEVFEFGRYANVKTKGYGVVIGKNLGKIAKISEGTITNIDEVVTKIKSRTEGEGPRLPMEWVLTDAPNIKRGIEHAKSVKEKDYSAADFSISNDSANCGTFALEVVKASGVNIPDSCFPTPNMMTREMKIFGIESGSI